MTIRCFSAAAMLFTFALTAPAAASFHAWEVSEVYSNADGSVQYIEFHTTLSEQHRVGSHTISANSDGIMRSFVIPSDLPDSATDDEFFTVATPGFENLPGAIVPDYLMPCGPFFNPSATSITVQIVGASPRTFAGSAVPLNGTQGLHFGAGLPSGGMAATAMPVNFDGLSGALALTACQVSGSCSACDDGAFCTGVEVCMTGACRAGPAVCVGEMCDESMNGCFECANVGDCNDLNPCTDDACETDRTCSHENNDDVCTDGLFCTMTDLCAAGVCVGAVDPCAAGTEMCLEGADACGTCANDVDCDNGLFCDGGEVCNGDNACVPAIAPCEVEDCVEGDDRCRACGDGFVDPGEGCDDDDTDAGDGCDAVCVLETGFSCAGEPSICSRMTDAGVDAGAGDAGGNDAGVVARLDGGLDAGSELIPAGGGCGCHAASTRGTPAMWLAIVAMGFLVVRRRRR